MTTSKRMHDPLTHRFAWDGFSFQTPEDWNLSEYSMRREASWVRMEDDHAVRLEMEWTRSRRAPDLERIRKRFADVSQSLTSADVETQKVPDLPEFWTAFLYAMPDGRRLLMAFRFTPGSDFFCFFKLHFEGVSLREPPRLIRLIASTFQLHEQDVIPWAMYNIEWRLNREFRLLATSFQAGRQAMTFEWRRRKLHLWFFSLADLMLRSQSLGAWCAGFLNGAKDIPGAQFKAGGQEGVILARRRRRYLLGHGEEIARWCFRYRAHGVYLTAKNQVALWVFQYRTEADLNRLLLNVGPFESDGAFESPPRPEQSVPGQS